MDMERIEEFSVREVRSYFGVTMDDDEIAPYSAYTVLTYTIHGDGGVTVSDSAGDTPSGYEMTIEQIQELRSILDKEEDRRHV